MKSSLKRSMLSLAIGVAAVGCVMTADAEHLVILTTNDTHSMIDPDGAMGGVARRKVLIDSVRQAEPNVLLVDAGDVVQGTLYFHIHKGELEEKLLNALGYDLRILGNHEFDNGMERLATNAAMSNAQYISTNYGMRGTVLEPYFKPYAIREVGGKRLGFIGVNLNPSGMIGDENVEGIKVIDPLEAANLTARFLKEIEQVDKVIALTHIGYDSEKGLTDPVLVANSTDIDMVIGGHSHTDLLDLEAKGKEGYYTVHKNADGRNVLITQQSKSGKYLGFIDIDLDNLDAVPQYREIPVDGRLDDRLDSAVTDIIAQYRVAVDSINAVPLIKSAIELPKGSDALINLMADFVYDRGVDMVKEAKAGRKPDLAIVNKGGIRRGQVKGQIYDGNLIDMLPFYNYIVVTDVPGDSLIQIFDVMGTTYGNGVSSHVKATYETYLDPEDNNKEKSRLVGQPLINGKPIDPNKTYRVATLDYLENGGDYMTGFKAGKRVAAADEWLYNTVLNNWRKLDSKGRKLNPDTTPRWTEVKK